MRLTGHSLRNAAIRGPFLLRSVEPPVTALYGHTVTDLRRAGKRIAVGFDHGLWLAIHLMIAGRLHWNGRRAPLATFEFDSGALTLTEAGTQHRAQIHVLNAPPETAGLEPLEASAEAFAAVLKSENHTLKRALTDPHIFSGIGNAYSDEILHAARLSPLKLTRSLDEAEIAALYGATRGTLTAWTDRLRVAAGGGFPEKVTAFHDAMAVHGRFRQPCPVCGSPVQRIVYAANECNYCATCQTGGRLLADRSLSRLLKDDWPRRLE